MESMTTPDDNLLQGISTISQQQPSGSNPLVPQLNPSGQPDLASLRETFVDTLWQGLMFYQPEKDQLPLRCTISSRVTSKEKHCADEWPKLLRLQLFPKLAEDTFSSLIHSDPHSVMIQFSKVSEASLCNILRPGLVGHVLFSSTTIEASRIMHIICLPESGIFLGSFFDHLIQEINIEEGMNPLLRPVVNNTNIQINASMPVSQQQPQQQDPQLLLQSIATERQAIIALYKETIDSAKDLYQLRAIHRRRVRQLQTKPYRKSKSKNSALTVENVSRISEASCTRGTTNSIVLSSKILDCLQSSLGPELHGIVNNYLFRNKSPEGFGKCPQTIEELYHEIRKHVETRVKPSGASTKDEEIEELMCKLKKCSVLQSLNE